MFPVGASFARTRDRERKVLSANTKYGGCGRGECPSMVMPLNVLEKSINKRVQLLLKDNRILEGKLVGYDDYMNMVLEDTEETKEDNVRRGDHRRELPLRTGARLLPGTRIPDRGPGRRRADSTRDRRRPEECGAVPSRSVRGIQWRHRRHD